MQKQEIINIQSESTLVYKDTRKTFERLESNELKREEADALANLLGKSLKALGLIQADRIFMQGLKNITPPKQSKITKK